ncbi:DNA polymerase alpha catalytic subunit -like protein [Babesia sp. Xinjiang]|uniref:DNA polymerase alpha catalytic subunit -like protein n=1 Tax=Babesia sp. Xinjiang TaxID=462227 RepID=UPI000A223E63|nr:DNA polymerase alpha catalytic subunit -like protein [Babesia sp. Xinjiang]ORM40295.1 DNA polymerase alpha catalytic subunit -like protein [Babesia sp. Xinjiang]
MPLVFLPQILWHSKDNKHCDRVYSLDFQPQVVDYSNGVKSVFKLATGGADEFVHIWQVSIHNNAPQYATHSDKSILAPENLRANATAGQSKSDCDVQPFTVKILARLVGHIGEINAVRWNPNGVVLASGGEDRCVFLWAKSEGSNNTLDGTSQDYEEHYSRFQYYRLSHVINSISWCPDGRLLAVSTEDGHVTLIDTFVEGSGKIRHFEGHTSFAQGVSICPKNIMIASMGQDQTLRIWKRRNEKQWKNILVLRSAKDRSEFKESIGMESDDVRYSRSVFMNEELSTFFRRLDWSPDGRFLVTPAGIRHNSLFRKEDEPEIKGDSVYTLYVFHRKLIHLGIPMVTHQSPTGPFVVVKFCPLDIGKIEKEKINFFNKMFKPMGKVAKKKVSKPKKSKAASGVNGQLGVANTATIAESFGRISTSSDPGCDVSVKEAEPTEAAASPADATSTSTNLENDISIKEEVEDHSTALSGSEPVCSQVDSGESIPVLHLIKNEDNIDLTQEMVSEAIECDMPSERAEAEDSDSRALRTSKREIKKPEFYDATFEPRKSSRGGCKSKKSKKDEDKEYDTDVEDEVHIFFKVLFVYFAALKRAFNDRITMDKSRSSAVSSALSKIRKHREGVANALEEYEIEDENEKIYEVVTAEEYKDRTSKRRLDEFIEGGEIFSDDDYDYESESGEDDHERPATKRQLPDGYGKSIEQHFTEIARKESMAYRPPKDAQSDKKLMEKLSRFEDDLDNEDIATSTSYATMPGKMPMSMGMGMPPVMGMPYGPMGHFQRFPQYQMYSQLDRQHPEEQLAAPVEHKAAPLSQRPAEEPKLDVNVMTSGMDIDEIVQEAEKMPFVPPLELDASIVADFGEVDTTELEVITTSSARDVIVPEFEKAIDTESEGFAFYLLDVHEDAGGLLRLFGKLHRGNTTESCVVTVRQFMRCLFFKARMDLDLGNMPEVESSYERAFMKQFFTEFEAIRKSYGIKKTKYKIVKRKLLRYGPSEEGLYVKVCYPFSHPQLRAEHYHGQTYEDVYGATTTPAELFLIKRKIKGPSWLRIIDAHPSTEKVTTCKHELDVESHKNVELWNARNSEELPMPTLCVASVSVKTFFASPTHQEVLQVAMIYDKNFRLDTTEIKQLNKCTQHIGIRKIEKLTWPSELNTFLKKRPYFRIFEHERGLLANFMKTLEVIDPDVVVGHDVTQNVSEFLLKRCNMLNIPLRVSFSRMKATKKYNHPFCAGRIFCDTRLVTKELYHNRSNYDLSSCVSDLVYSMQVKEHPLYTKQSFNLKELIPCFAEESMKELMTLVQANSKCALDAFNLLIKLQALPLTKELTNIAGNLWSRSVQCARSERNDFLLLHEFHKAKYIIDHNFERYHKHTVATADNEKEEGDSKKKNYEGGLVLEPITGLYDNFILLLDFNSLYPSIIQEFNVCFTTMQLVDDDTAEMVTDSPGMLPQILRRLVELRASVKAAIAVERNEVRKAQLGVRQLALKLVANSLYGCLGSVYSRFHARHMAAYITQQGRMVLQSTRERVEKQYSLRVIYGDTDSLMIDTNIRDEGSESAYEAAQQVANTLMTSINKSHKKLEIGMDAMFNRLLLLKKKKYAALKVVDYKTRTFAREIKGLDFIRRDWSILTKEVGNALLAIILSDKTSESESHGVENTVERIHDTLREVNARIEEGKIPAKAWIITRQLAKNPNEYGSNANLPHVTVALRMNESGATYSAGHEVPFIICSKESIAKHMLSEACDNVESKESLESKLRSLCNRAYSLVEFQQKGLEPDIHYYKAQQLLPPILRLCGVIDGTDPQKLASCLQIQDEVNKTILNTYYGSFDYAEHESKALSLINRTDERYREVEVTTSVPCQFCNSAVPANYFLKHMTCSNCTNWLPLHSMRNWISRTIYEISLQSSFCIRICNICNTTTPNVCIGDNDVCPQPTCQSRDAMEVVLPASKIYLYYEYLIYMLEGALVHEGGIEKEDTLVNVTVDINGKMNVLPSHSPFRKVRLFRDILDGTIRRSNLPATSGFRVCGQYILGILEALPFMQYHTVDYKVEREELCQFVKDLQQRNAYSVVSLSDIFDTLTVS